MNEKHWIRYEKTAFQVGTERYPRDITFVSKVDHNLPRLQRLYIGISQNQRLESCQPLKIEFSEIGAKNPSIDAAMSARPAITAQENTLARPPSPRSLCRLTNSAKNRSACM